MTDAPDVVRQRGSRLTSGRKFSADELQLMLLGFLAESDAHGYGLIRRFKDLSRGYYSPSPGALYPALRQLEASGLATVEASGNRKTYRISKAGRAELHGQADRARQLVAILEHAARKMLWMSRIGEGEAAATAATGWLPEFVQARKALRAALLEQGDADHAGQRRLANILQRAVREIRQGAATGNDAPAPNGE